MAQDDRTGDGSTSAGRARARKPPPRITPHQAPNRQREPIAALCPGPPPEGGAPLSDLPPHCPDVRTGRKCLPSLRRTVTDMLNAAQAILPAGYGFRVTTALRTLAIQRELYERYYAKLQNEHPGWSRATLRRA